MKIFKTLILVISIFTHTDNAFSEEYFWVWEKNEPICRKLEKNNLSLIFVKYLEKLNKAPDYWERDNVLIPYFYNGSDLLMLAHGTKEVCSKYSNEYVHYWKTGMQKCESIHNFLNFNILNSYDDKSNIKVNSPDNLTKYFTYEKKIIHVWSKDRETCSIYSNTQSVGIAGKSIYEDDSETQRNNTVNRRYQCKAACLDYDRPYSKQHIDIEFFISAANNIDLAKKAYSAHTQMCQKNGWTKRFLDPSCY